MALALDPDGRQASVSEFLNDLRVPNPDYISAADAPLLERNPVAFWKAVSALLGAVILILLCLMLGGS